MTLRQPLLFLTLLAGLAIVGCTSSDSGTAETGNGGLIGFPQPLNTGGDDPETPPVNTLTGVAAIAGLWDNSIAEAGSGNVNVFYLEITSAGEWVNYDYLGDSVDQGPNCYITSVGEIRSLGSNTFRVTVAGGVIEFGGQVVNGGLVITGNLGVVTLPAAVGLSSVDFNLC